MAVDILIVEDEPGILESLVFILRRAGWSVTTETDGQAALSSLANQPPRLLVLDVMLPKISGFEILKRLRAGATTQDLPVLMLTAKGQVQDKRTAEELGASAFVTKPYSNKDVVEIVRRLLESESVVR